MAFFVGDLVVSVLGCSLDEKDGPLVDPCVELSVGNKLHSTALPVQSLEDATRKGRGSSSRNPEECTPVAFHGVTEEDALTVTVLDRASPPNDSRDAFVAEAEPLLCTDWGPGGRPVRRTCVIAAPEQMLWQDKVGSERLPPGRAASGSRREGKRLGRNTVQLSLCWSPKIRLRKPLSLVASAGRRTSTALSSKIDRPVSAVLNFVLDLAAYASALGPGWKRTAVAASVASVSVGSACVVTIAAFFLPFTVALAAVAATLAPTATAVGWILACTRPACDYLWRPLLVWSATRSAAAKGLLLLPWAYGQEAPGGALGRNGGGLLVEEDVAGGREPGAAVRRDGNVYEKDWQQAAPLSGTDMPVEEDRSNGPDAIGSATAGVVLLLTCYQNMVGILYGGLQASRWRPRPR